MNNFFHSIPADSSQELFAEIHRAERIRIERIVSFGQSSPEGFWYNQDEDEWIMILEGGAGILREDDPQIKEMKPGDYMNIPAHVKHRVVWTVQTRRTVWLAIHYRAS